MKTISLVFLVSALAINVSPATGDEKVDLWNRKDVVPDSCRKWLPEVSKTTGLTRVWVRTNRFGFNLSDKGAQVIKSTKPSSVYRTRLSKTKMILGKRSDPKWKTYEVRRYGKLLVASELTADGTTQDTPTLLGFDASGQHVKALDKFYRLLEAESQDKAQYEGKELVTLFHRDSELWFRLAKVTPDGSEPLNLLLTQVVAEGTVRSAAESRKNVNAHPKFKAKTLEFLAALAYSTELIQLIEKSIPTAEQPASPADKAISLKDARENDSVLRPMDRKLLPPKGNNIFGLNEVRVRNPNPMSVVTGLRTKEGGRDFKIPPLRTASVTVPDGNYDIYFIYSNKPDILFQGDSFTLKSNGVEIHLVQVVGGNYGIRRVKKNSQELKITLDGGSLVVDGLRSSSTKTLLLWRQYHLENGAWVANCVPVPTHARIPLSGTGVVVKEAIRGLGQVSIWLSPADAPYEMLSDKLTTANLVEVVDSLAHYIDTGTKFTFTDTDGVKRTFSGKFIAFSNKQKSRRQFTGETENGLIFGGSEIEGQQYVGVYKTVPIDQESTRIEDAGNSALKPITSVFKAHHREDGAPLIELWNKLGE